MFLFVYDFLPQSNLVAHGEVVLQDSFQVWDPKHIFRKGRERHIFLFEMFLVLSKEGRDSTGKTKYIYKNKLDVSIICSDFDLRGYRTPNLKLARFVCSLKIINIFLKNNICILKQIVQRTQMALNF